MSYSYPIQNHAGRVGGLWYDLMQDTMVSEKGLLCF